MDQLQTPEAGHPQVVHKAINIAAPAEKVWAALTDPDQMKQWMSPDSPIEIITDWMVGKPLTVRGPCYKNTFENRGIVLIFEPGHRVAYTHLSSLSRLPAVPVHSTALDFKLKQADEDTELELTLTNFPTEIIYHHMVYYWQVTLHVLKRYVERDTLASASNTSSKPKNRK